MADFDRATGLGDGVTLSDLARALGDALGPFVAATALFAAFSCLIMFSTFLILQKDLRGRCTRILLLVTWTMYATATTTWAIQRRALFSVAGALSSFATCLDAGTTACAPPNPPYPPFSAHGHERAAWSATTTALLVVNVVLADGVLLWRAYIRWRPYRVVRAVSYALPVATLALFAVDAREAYRDAKDQNADPSFATPTPGSLGLAASLLSLAAKLWATALVASTTWKTRHAIVDDFRASDVKSRTLKALVLSLELGAPCCCLWILFIAFNASSHLRSFSGLRILFDRGGCLISLLVTPDTPHRSRPNPLVAQGLYPTLFIALLAHNSAAPAAHAHASTHDASVSTLVVASPSPSDADSDGANVDDTLESADFEGSMRTTRSQGVDEKGFDARSFVSI
ncbi:hypothetical protein OF83DRAFT_1081267 [Amylostereum chailletii]|nr:hypothetical protein OF83DRAFT_1081267 [Amylostereum chailletii]